MISQAVLKIHDTIGTGVGCLVYGTEKAGEKIYDEVKPVAVKVGEFVQKNWPKLVAYTIAWGVVITCSGLLYGFQAVALPLTIGLACGFGAGTLGAILLKITDPQNKRSEWTLWSGLNKGFSHIHDEGTRYLVQGVVFYVILAMCSIYPYAAGAILGVFVGNQLINKIVYSVHGIERNLGPANDNEKEELHKLQTMLEEALHEVNKKLKYYELQDPSSQTEI